MTTKARELRIGVAGLGRAGWSMHVEAIRARTDARVVAVADPQPDRRDQAVRELDARAYATVADLVADPKVDLVVLATPSIAHAGDTLAAFAAGKHVIVEKPMAMNVAQADAMIAASTAAGRELFVHHNLRFSREFTFLQDAIRSGKLGPMFHIRLNHLLYMRRNDWQCLKRNGGGLLNNAGSHFLDLTLALLPAPVVDVVGHLRQVCSAGDAEDFVKIFLRCADGCTADIEVSTAHAIDGPMITWMLCGAHGTLVSDNKLAKIRWYDPKDAPPLQLHDGAATERKYGNDEVLPWRQESVSAIGSDIGSFYDNVLATLNAGASKRVTPQSVREVIRVIGEVRAYNDKQ